MNLNHLAIGKHLILMVLTFICFHAEAVKSVNSLSITHKKELSKQEFKKQNKDLTLKQKLSLFLIKKLANRKTKQSSKGKAGFKKKGWANASMIMGIISLILIPITIVASFYMIFLPGVFVSGILGVLAIIFAGNSKKRIKLSPEEHGGNGLATTGLVVGIISVAFWLFILFSWLAFLGVLLPLFG